MRQFAAVFGAMLLAACLASAGQAQTQQRSAAYLQAEQAYQRFSDRDRISLQLLLISAGFSSAVPNIDFSARTFDALRTFQQNAGFEPTGVLDPSQVAVLKGAAAPTVRQWQLRDVQHPTTQRSIWLPAGLGLTRSAVDNGVQFTNQDRSLVISFLHFPTTDFGKAPETMAQVVSRNQGRVTFDVKRPDFFVIGSDLAGGRSGYLRFHREPAGGMSGFMMQWSTSATALRGERMATVISASLWDSANRTGLMRTDNLLALVTPQQQPSQAPRPEGSPPPQQQQQPTQQAQPAPQPRQEQAQPRQEQAPPRSSLSTGTGFFVSRDGHILTNAHVVDGCSNVEVRQLGQPGVRARIMARDRTNDLAIIASDVRSQAIGATRGAVRLGEQVVTFGFPLSGSLSTSGNFTIGNVTSLAGLGDDSRFIQMSTPVQPGNSGGALLDQSGNVVGIVTSKLNAVRTAAATGDIPQNVNFAVKSQIAMGFLETHRVPLSPTTAERALSATELADTGRAMTVQLVCQPGQ
jgi:S1-C subfamily serine protease